MSRFSLTAGSRREAAPKPRGAIPRPQPSLRAELQHHGRRTPVRWRDCAHRLSSRKRAALSRTHRAGTTPSQWIPALRFAPAGMTGLWSPLAMRSHTHHPHQPTGKPMFRKSTDHYRCIDNARRAVRAGNPAEAERWLRIADHLLSLQERRNRLHPSATAATGPVMLDPRGFSPGGTPNWVLNQQRVERSRDGQRNPPAPPRTSPEPGS